MSAIADAPLRHIAAGNPFAIGLYIEELQAMNYSPARIRQTLEREGLLPPPSCKQVEDALLKQDFSGAVLAVRVLKRERTVEGFRTQLSCLRMRLEYRHGVNSSAVTMLMKVRRAAG